MRRNMLHVQMTNPYNGKTSNVNLPATEKELYHALLEIDMATDRWYVPYEVIPKLGIDYNIDDMTIVEKFGHILLEESSIVLINAICMMMQEMDDWRIDNAEYLYDYLYDECNSSFDTAMDIFPILFNSDDIPYYSFEYNDGFAMHNFGKTIGMNSGYRIPEEIIDFIDWEAYGEYYSDGYYITNDGYLETYDIDYYIKPDDYTWHDLLECVGWSIEPEDYEDFVCNNESNILSDELFNILSFNDGADKICNEVGVI